MEDEVELIEEGALDRLAHRTGCSTRHPHSSGSVSPVGQKETCLICRIHAMEMILDAIHT